VVPATEPLRPQIHHACHELPWMIPLATRALTAIYMAIIELTRRYYLQKATMSETDDFFDVVKP
jgi:hypothetical protein